MCKYCKDFNEEKSEMQIYEIYVEESYYIYECPIRYCPNCGKILNKYR